jgi:hypothetical protein
MGRKVFSVAVVVGMMLVGGVSVAQAHQTVILRVVADPANTFDGQVPTGAHGGAPFYVAGDICADAAPGAPCNPIGKFHCWGWGVGSGGAFVAQEFEIFGRGKLQVQGAEDAGPRAFTGGTGDFAFARGQATGIDFTNFPPEFIITFELEGVMHHIEP